MTGRFDQYQRSCKQIEDHVSIFGKWEFSCDRQATIDAYARATHGNSERCICSGCRNFAAARGQAFPIAFVELLESLGIDSRKDGEVYHNAQLPSGLHDYGGWFHFVGTLAKTGQFPEVELAPGFTAWMCEKSAPSLEVFAGLPLVQVEFHTERVPWVLNESPAM
jgi:hypothetical protein